MLFRVELTGTAQGDLDAILEWLLAGEAGERGHLWFQKLKEALFSLSELPRRCPVAPEDAEFPFEVRQLLYGRKPRQYRVLFTIEEKRIVILHIDMVVADTLVNRIRGLVFVGLPIGAVSSVPGFHWLLVAPSSSQTS